MLEGLRILYICGYWFGYWCLNLLVCLLAELVVGVAFLCLFWDDYVGV